MLLSPCREGKYLLGAIEAISALVKMLVYFPYTVDEQNTNIDAINASMKSQTIMVVQMRPAVPLGRQSAKAILCAD